MKNYLLIVIMEPSNHCWIQTNEARRSEPRSSMQIFFQKSIYVNNQCDTDQFQVWGWRHKDAILSPVITEYFSR